jgi:16S rRNA (uracil1498-N3)-methyltransferase
LDFDILIEKLPEYDVAFLAWEDESQANLVSTAARYSDAKRLLLLIGPEGGFDRQEIERGRQAGIHTVSLGPRRLRSDTASIVALALLVSR